MAMGWEFVFKRRGWTLENFLKDCPSVEDAYEKFNKGGMSPPSSEVLDLYYAPTAVPPREEVQGWKSAPGSSTHTLTGEYDDIVVIETEEQ